MNKKVVVRPAIEYSLLGIVLTVSCLYVLIVARFTVFPTMIITAVAVLGLVEATIPLYCSYTIDGDAVSVRKGLTKKVMLLDGIAEVTARKHYARFYKTYTTVEITGSDKIIDLSGYYIDLSILLKYLTENITAVNWDEDYVIHRKSTDILTHDERRLYSYRIYHANKVLRPGLKISATACLVGAFVDLYTATWLILPAIVFTCGYYVCYYDLYIPERIAGSRDWTTSWSRVGEKTDYKMIADHLAVFLLGSTVLIYRYSEILVIDFGQDIQKDICLLLMLGAVAIGNFLMDFHNNDLAGMLGVLAMMFVIFILYLYLPWMFSDSSIISGILATSESKQSLVTFTYGDERFEIASRLPSLLKRYGETVPVQIRTSPFGRVSAHIPGGFHVQYHFLQNLFD